MSRIAITGTASYLGGRVLRRLVEERGADRVLALDIAAPPTTLHGVRHRMVDLTLPGADQRLVDVFQEEHVDTVFHAAFFTTPRRDAAYSHELESIGTLHLAAAAAAAGVRHLVLRSFTAVYGARGQNPNFLTEERRPDARSPLAWVRDKVEAEDHAFSFSRRYPGLGVTVLRFATLLGARCPHLLHPHLQQAGGPGGPGLRPARPVPPPRRRPARRRRRAREGPLRDRQRGAARHDVAADRTPPLGQADRRRSARRGLPGGGPVVGLRRGGGPGRLHRLRSLPLRGRRREGPARARLRGTPHEPGRADGATSSTATRTRPAARRSRGSGSARKRTPRRPRLERGGQGRPDLDARAAPAHAGPGGGRAPPAPRPSWSGSSRSRAPRRSTRAFS